MFITFETILMIYSQIFGIFQKLDETEHNFAHRLLNYLQENDVRHKFDDILLHPNNKISANSLLILWLVNSREFLNFRYVDIKITEFYQANTSIRKNDALVEARDFPSSNGSELAIMLRDRGFTLNETTRALHKLGFAVAHVSIKLNNNEVRYIVVSKLRLDNKNLLSRIQYKLEQIIEGLISIVTTIPLVNEPLDSNHEYEYIPWLVQRQIFQWDKPLMLNVPVIYQEKITT